MNCLLYKDFMILKSQWRIYMVLYVFYAVMSVASENINMMLGMLGMLSLVILMNTFSYDNYSKWGKYAVSMPISRKEIVLSKYLFILLINIINILCSMLIIFVYTVLKPGVSMSEIFLVLGGIFGICLLYSAIMIPICFRFSQEKARMLMMLIFLIPFAATLLLARIAESRNLPLSISMPTKQMAVVLMAGFALSTILAYIISIFCSIRIYSNKEI